MDVEVPSPTSEDLFRAVVESATDFAIFALDFQGRVITWNLGAERLIGYSEQEVIGRDGAIIFTPEDREAGVPAREQQDALAAGRAEDDRWHLRKDGSRFWASGLLMPLRGVNGFVKILRDRTRSHRIEETLRQSEARFRTLATNIPQLVFRTRSNGERTWGSPQWEVFTGLSDHASRGFGWLDAVHPEDRERTRAGWSEAQESYSYRIEHRIRRRADGEYRWHQTEARRGEAAGTSSEEWVGTSTDIHELRGLKDRQQMLLEELQHRSRNLIAIVQAIARQTLRKAETMEKFAADFEGRLKALGRAQNLLARMENEKVELRDLVEAELFARGDYSAVVTIAGPPVELGPIAAQAIALALHELATNAVKYGAFSQPAGRLDVSWFISDATNESRVVLEWAEQGVQMPNQLGRRKGYGSELIERALPYQLNAETKLQFADNGVRCSIAVPVARVKE